MKRSAAVQAHRSTAPGDPQARGSGARRQFVKARLWWLTCVALVFTLVPAPRADAAVITQDEEIRIGRQVAADLEAEVGLASDPAMTARLARIGRRVAAASDRRDLPYTFKVLRGRDVNAVALPGGFIYATVGLMQFVQSDAELGFVMAHEVGHVAARHHVTVIERELLVGLLSRVLLGDSAAAQIAGIARGLISRGFSRENEFEADRLGVIYTHKAGFNASAGLRFMERLRAMEGRDPGQIEVLLRTHPGLRDRIQRVRDQLVRLGYRIAALPALSALARLQTRFRLAPRLAATVPSTSRGVSALRLAARRQP